MLDELKAMRIWVCWNYVPDKDGKKRKVPCASDGSETSANPVEHGSTWNTYENVVTAKEQEHYDGIGLVLPEGYFLLDLDHKELDNPLIQTMLSRFHSYAEYSVSGNGIHILGKVDVNQIPTYVDAKGERKLSRDFYMKNSVAGVELYAGGLTNRFATVTEKTINDLPLADCTAAYLTTLDKDMRKSKKQRYSKKRDGESRADFDLICALRKQKNGEKFIKLYDKGDFSDYGSQSEADAALCAMLAFRTGPDPAAIDQLFRGSALYRAKWEREDYRTDTIQFGIDACHGKFHQSLMTHPDFIRFKENGTAYVLIPALAEYVRQTLRYILVRNNGKEGVLLYVYKDGVYRLYSQDMMLGEIKKFIADYDPELVRMSDVNGAYQHIMTDLNYVPQDELNSDESLINFRNGLLRVTADRLELLPHSPDVYSTVQLPCKWIGCETPTPVYDAYMDALTRHDAEKAKLLYEINGVTISNVYASRMKKALFMVGPGDTGKSQNKALFERILGRGNFIGIDLKEIEDRFGTGAIYGTRLAGSSDMSFLSVGELKAFKKLTGGDSVYAEFKGQQPFEFTYKGILWFCMNRLPKFGGDDGKWVYERIIVLNCDNVIPPEKQDKRLLDKMYDEREGIVYKSIKALQQVIANGYRYDEPQSVTDAREAYRAENSTVISFFNECMCLKNGGSADCFTANKVYQVYRDWCKDNNNGYAKTAKEFREILSGHLGKSYAELTTHTKVGTCYKDYTLTEECKEQYNLCYGTDFLA